VCWILGLKNEFILFYIGKYDANILKYKKYKIFYKKYYILEDYQKTPEKIRG
jgi:hypothetical protein